MSSPTDPTPPGQDTIRQSAAQIANTARWVGTQLMDNSPQLTKAAQQTAQQAQRVIQDNPGAAVTVLGGLGMILLRRRSQHRRHKARKTRQRHRRPATGRARQWVRVLALVGWLIRRRYKKTREDAANR